MSRLAENNHTGGTLLKLLSKLTTVIYRQLTVRASSIVNDKSKDVQQLVLSALYSQQVCNLCVDKPRNKVADTFS